MQPPVYFQQQATMPKPKPAVAPTGPPVQQPGAGTNPYIGSNFANNLAAMGYGTSGMAPFAGMNFLGQSVLPAYMESILAQLQNKNQLQGQGHAALQATLRNLTPAARQARLDAVRRRANANAKRTASQGDSMLRELGISSGGREGAVMDAYQDADRAVFDWDAQMNSPGGQVQSAAQLMGLIQQGSQVDLPQLLAMLQSIGQWDRDRHGFAAMNDKDGILGGLGGILGNVLGGGIPGLGNLFGGGGGGGNASNSYNLPAPVSGY